MMDTTARELLDFWLDLGEAAWYRADVAVDDACRTRWGALWEEARTGALDGWRSSPDGALALLILLDQIPRNIFRGDARSFATDRLALAASKATILSSMDRRIDRPQRQFVYTPLMHSEVLANQDQSVRMYLLNFGRTDLLTHARAHREVIRRFGRFPFRNAALGRESTPAEVAFLADGGYMAVVEALASEDATTH